MVVSSELRLPAIEVKQGPKRTLYTFAVDAKEIHRFATISRVRRDVETKISGYQRPEVVSHIADIRAYLESENPMVPNAIGVAFDGRARFDPSDFETEVAAPYCRPGHLVLPIEDGLADDEKPGWIVDGQQRIAAIRECKLKSFPMCVTAFIAPSDEEQREQFILVNSTKPLPKGLIYELLPSTAAKLPSLLQKRRFPAYLTNRLNYDKDSPLKSMIRTPTTTDGVIKDNSILKMLENSLSDGALYRYRDPTSGTGQIEKMLDVVKGFWGATSEVFEEAWGKPPKQSRLMHGAGVVSLGFVMDAIADRHRQDGVPAPQKFKDDLLPLRDVCRWTDGYWDFGPGAQRKWNEIQNTSKDIQLLANYLLVQYKSRVWSDRRA